MAQAGPYKVLPGKRSLIFPVRVGPTVRDVLLPNGERKTESKAKKRLGKKREKSLNCILATILNPASGLPLGIIVEGFSTAYSLFLQLICVSSICCDHLKDSC
jgi:hypothetical protein